MNLLKLKKKSLWQGWTRWSPVLSPLLPVPVGAVTDRVVLFHAGFP